MTLAILDTGSGNLRSVQKAFERVGREAGAEQPVLVTHDPAVVRRAERVVLPGVGAFGDCMDGLNAVDGLRDALTDAVHGQGRPFLGICVGMQMLADQGLEHGRHAGLGWIPGTVGPLTPSDPALKIPHMGWNRLALRGAHPVLDGLTASGSDHAYFVHSYAFAADDPGHVLAEADYGGAVAAVIGRDNLLATQFHPEKSQALGLALLSAFLMWRP